MPEKDGYEVCDYIKKNLSLSHIPVLLLTGAFEPFDQERANRVGCDGFLAKPFEPQTLIAKVKDLLAKAGPKATTGAFRAVPATPPSPSPAVPPPELSPVTAEESASLGGASKEPDGSSTVMFHPGKAPWSQQTIEVPLELRAQAGVSAQAEAEPLFEDVFDEPLAPPAAPPAAPAPTPVASGTDDEPEEVFAEAQEDETPAAPWSAPPSTTAASASFAGVNPAAPPEPAATPPSQAADVSVPPDMVEKIAQRVVAQISEKVVREVAWEIIPDLAEALIKKEIDRLKDELQRT
jgi:hypothetical protein